MKSTLKTDKYGNVMQGPAGQSFVFTPAGDIDYSRSGSAPSPYQAPQPPTWEQQAADSARQRAINQGTHTPAVISDSTIRDSVIPGISSKAQSMLPPAGVSVGANGAWIDSRTPTSPNGTTTRTDSQPGGVNYNYGTDYDRMLADIDAAPPALSETEQRLFDLQSQQLDAESKATIARVQRQYSGLIKTLQEKQGQSSEVLKNTLNIAGSGRYAPISSSNMLASKTERDVSDLQALSDEENALIAEAQAAKSAGEMRILGLKLEALEKKKRDKVALAGKIADQMNEENKRIRAEQQKEQEEIGKVITEAAKAGPVPRDVLEKAQNAGSLIGAITELGDYLSNAKTLTGDAKNYADYKTMAQLSGVTPLSPIDWYTKYGPGKSVVETAPGDYTPAQNKLISSVDDKVSKNAVYSATTNMQKAVGVVKTALSQRNGLADIAAINQFQKIIDEGAVTRDQDVVLIQGAQSLYNTLKTKIKKLEGGDQLSEDQRKQMLDLTDDIFKTQKEALLNDPFISSKIKELERNGVDLGDTIIGGITENYNAKIIEEQKNTDQILDQYHIDHPDESEFLDEMERTIGPDATLDYLRKTKKVTVNSVGSDTDTASIRNAIVAQESGGNYKAVNRDSGALGRYQIMPFNLPTLIGLADTPANRQKFLDSPQLQDRAFDALLAELNATYDGDVRKVLAAYYGGAKAAQVVGTPAGDKSQGKYPSVNQYVGQVISKINSA